MIYFSILPTTWRIQYVCVIKERVQGVRLSNRKCLEMLKFNTVHLFKMIYDAQKRDEMVVLFFLQLSLCLAVCKVFFSLFLRKIIQTVCKGLRNTVLRNFSPSPVFSFQETLSAAGPRCPEVWRRQSAALLVNASSSS